MMHEKSQKGNQNNKAWSDKVMHLIHLQLTRGKNAQRVLLNLTINESGINDEFRENFVT